MVWFVGTRAVNSLLTENRVINNHLQCIFLNIIAILLVCPTKVDVRFYICGNSEYFRAVNNIFSVPFRVRDLSGYGGYHMSRVKLICVFEHSVMTNFNCACPAIQRGQGSGFLSEGSS